MPSRRDLCIHLLANPAGFADGNLGRTARLGAGYEWCRPMSTPHVKYLLLGGGLASASAASAIRAIDPRGELVLVGQERIAPYQRPPLSKLYLRQRWNRADLLKFLPAWYAEHQVQLRTGMRASHIDAARHIVIMESGEEIGFDRLLIATGVAPLHLKIPGADLPGIYYLRTADDADRIHNAIDQAISDHPKSSSRPPARVAVIGAGLLGVELTATLTNLGLKVDLFSSKPHPWFKFAGEHTGRFITRYLEDHGVTVHSQSAPRALEGDGRVQRVITEEGATPCDFAVVAVGGIVNRDLLRGTPIRCEKAILADARCRTNVEGIYAAGDCAAVFDPLFGKHRVHDHYDGAETTGTIAGRNMAGLETVYNAVNTFETEVFNLTLQGWGEAKQVDRRLIRASATDPTSFIEIGIAADGRIAQIVAVNHEADAELLRSFVARRVLATGNEEALRDPAVPLVAFI